MVHVLDTLELLDLKLISDCLHLFDAAKTISAVCRNIFNSPIPIHIDVPIKLKSNEQNVQVYTIQDLSDKINSDLPTDNEGEQQI